MKKECTIAQYILYTQVSYFLWEDDMFIDFVYIIEKNIEYCNTFEMVRHFTSVKCILSENIYTK